MKKIVLVCVTLVFIFCSCNKDEDGFNSEKSSQASFKVEVSSEDILKSNAVVMCIFSDTEEAIFSCDNRGFVDISVQKPIKMIIAMAPGLSSIVENPNYSQGLLQMRLEVAPSSNLIRKKSAEYIGAFGVYDTDGSGDVRFRYQGTFIDYYCLNNLPWLGSSPDPNDWDGWDLTDFTPWNGKKLLVPRRYQTYHSTVFGYSISDALILEANI